MYLAAKRAEAEAIIDKATITDLAGISNSFTGSRLRPFIQKHNLCAVDHIRLNAKDIQILLNLIHPYHIMIRWSPYLQFNILKSNFSKASLNYEIVLGSLKCKTHTWMVRWLLWCARQREQSEPFVQSKQYILHSLLGEWTSHWTKKCSLSRGFSHAGHRWFSSSSSPSPPCKNHYQQHHSLTHWLLNTKVFTFIERLLTWFLKFWTFSTVNDFI